MPFSYQPSVFALALLIASFMLFSSFVAGTTGGMFVNVLHSIGFIQTSTSCYQVEFLPDGAPDLELGRKSPNHGSI